MSRSPDPRGPRPRESATRIRVRGFPLISATNLRGNVPLILPPRTGSTVDNKQGAPRDSGTSETKGEGEKGKRKDEIAHTMRSASGTRGELRWRDPTWKQNRGHESCHRSPALSRSSIFTRTSSIRGGYLRDCANMRKKKRRGRANVCAVTRFQVVERLRNGGAAAFEGRRALCAFEVHNGLAFVANFVDGLLMVVQFSYGPRTRRDFHWFGIGGCTKWGCDSTGSVSFNFFGVLIIRISVDGFSIF